MRWPLRNQILFPTLLLVLAAVAGTCAVHAWLAVRGAWQRIEASLNQVTGTLNQTSIPLTPSVLMQMRGLSGAEFVVTANERQVATTLDDSTLAGVTFPSLPANPSALLDRARVVRIGARDYLHTAVAVRGRESPRLLHVLYPRDSWQREAWRSVWPGVVTGGVAFLLTGLVSAWVAERVSRPLRGLRSQVERIAQGDFGPVTSLSGNRRGLVPIRAVSGENRYLTPSLGGFRTGSGLEARDDEVADLGRAVSQMAAQLQTYEQEVRQNERLRTLDQIGAGLAHQLRNSATGCRLAVELYCQRHPEAEAEGLRVALQQLDIIENYLHRFLVASGRPRPGEKQVVDVDSLMKSVAGLMAPLAAHLGVELRCESATAGLGIAGSQFELEQMLANLVRNGIEAAAARKARGETPAAFARLAAAASGDRIELRVTDNGDGPAESIQGQLFQPFHSDKPEGSGLGLSIARLIALDHDGTIDWERWSGETLFRVRLPRPVAPR